MRRALGSFGMVLWLGCGGTTIYRDDAASDDATGADAIADGALDAVDGALAEATTDTPSGSLSCAWTLSAPKQITAFDHAIQFGNAIELTGGAGGTHDVLIAQTCADHPCADSTWSAQRIDELGATIDAYTLFVDKPSTGAASNAYLGTPAGGVASAWDVVNGCRVVRLGPDERPSGIARSVGRNPCFAPVAEEGDVSVLSMPSGGSGPLSLIVAGDVGAVTVGPRLDVVGAGVGVIAAERAPGQPFALAYATTKLGAEALDVARVSSAGVPIVGAHAVATLGASGAAVQLVGTDDGGHLLVTREPSGAGSRLYAMRLTDDLKVNGVKTKLVDSVSFDVGFSVVRTHPAGARPDILVAYVETGVADPVASGRLKLLVLDGLGAPRGGLEQASAIVDAHVQVVPTTGGALAVWEGIAGGNPKQLFATPLRCALPGL